MPLEQGDDLVERSVSPGYFPHIRKLPASIMGRAMAATQRSMAISDLRLPDAPLVFVNPAFEEVTGYTSEEVLGKNCRFLQGPETDADIVRRVSEAVSQRIPVTLTLLNYRKDGTTFWNELSLAPISGDDGVVTHYVGVQTDVTAQILAQLNLHAAYASERSAHEEAQEISRRLSAIVTQMPSGVLIASAPSGRLLLGNEQMERVFRHEFIPADSVEEYDRYGGFDAEGKPLQPERWPLARSVCSGEVVIDEEITIERGDGTLGVILVRSAPIHDEDGKIVAAVEVFDDITARKQAEYELANARERANTLAQSLQRSLLPAALPVVDGLEFGAAYSPVGEGLEVGGDFYDVFEQRDGEWILVIGDVMGKGVEAAAVTSLARHALRTAALRARRPVPLLKVLNEALLREGENRPFCTVASAVLNRTRDGAKLMLALAGHPKPFVLRSDGSVDAIGVPGTLMGVIADVHLEEVEYELAPGDMMVMFTDGATEAHTESKFLGEDGLRRILSKLAMSNLGAQGLADAVQAEVEKFVGRELKDDLAILVAKAGTGRSAASVHL